MLSRSHISRYRLILLATIALLAGAMAVPPVLAAEFREGQTVVIKAGEVVNDHLYVTAEELLIDGRVEGDVLAIASRITVNGVIEGDLLALAQSVRVNGTVENVRAGGAVIQLGPNARVGRDALLMGASIESRAGSMIGADLLIGAEQALLEGAIGRDLRGGLARLEIGGSVDRDVEVTVSGGNEPSPARFYGQGDLVAPVVPAGLTLGPEAQIGGKLHYTTPEQLELNAGQVSGGIQRSALEAPAVTPAANPLLGYLRRLATLLIIGLGMILIFTGWTRSKADMIADQPLPTFGWGIVSFFVWLGMVVFGIPLLMILLASLAGLLTLGGLVGLTITLGLLLEATLIIAFIVYIGFIAPVVVGYYAGQEILARTSPAANERAYLPLILGLVIVATLMALPMVGWIFGLAVTLLGLGILWREAAALVRRSPPAPRFASGMGVA